MLRKLCLAVIGMLMTALAISDSAKGDDTYEREKWWPSVWGADDQLGAMNRLGPEKVLEAVALISKGIVYDMTRIVDEDMPLFELTPQRRKYTLSIPGAPSWGPLGRNKLAWNEEYISGHLGQNGTQFDALSHMSTMFGESGDLRNLRYYNGLRHSDIATSRGFTSLGVEKTIPIFTNGILIDLMAYRGRMLNKSEEITVSDIEGALKRQGLSTADISPGDAFFYNTGWGDLWKIDNAKFNSGTPGLSSAAGDWVISKEVVMVGTDNWAVEAIPGPDPNLFAPNHQKFLVENGIYIMENLDFTKLIEDRVYQFAFIFGAVPLRGATGAPGRPIAVK